MKHKTPSDYEQKYADFIKLCDAQKTSGLTEVIISDPWVIGDTYDEVIESLTRLAKANLVLRIARA